MTANFTQPELELVLVPVRLRDIATIQLSPENDQIYGAIDLNDPDTLSLAQSIQQHGVRTPLLVSKDGFLISGHRRIHAARLAGLSQVPVQIYQIERASDPDRFLQLLVTLNKQRIKSASVQLKESVAEIDPKQAYAKIKNQRLQKERKLQEAALNWFISADGERCTISPAKAEFLTAIQRVLDEQRDYWPLSDRQIHYRLLGPDAPLTHSSKPESRYRNDKSSYRNLTDLLTRARIEGHIAWGAIEDETRPVDLNCAFQNPGDFFRSQLERFLCGYWRNRQQSQPDHIEIIGEKLTVRSILQPVAEEFTIPLTITRGMCSLPPKQKIYSRYRMSQKERLILLVVSDLDPAGEAIAEDLLKSLRRDFGVVNIEMTKVALGIEQVEQFGLAPSMEAKTTSPTYGTFVDRYGISSAYELEALEPAILAQILTESIKEVLDIERYNEELEAEENDSAQIVAVREQADAFFRSLNLTPNPNSDGESQ
jgi:hypothetical protein